MKTLTVATLFAAAFFCGCHYDPFSPYVYPPKPPRGVVVYAGDGFVDIAWSPNAEGNIVEYRVYSAPAYGGPYTFVGASSVPGFRDFRARNGFLYYYAVTAVDFNGVESEYSLEEVYTIPRPEGYGAVLSNFRHFPQSAGWDFSGYRSVPYDDQGCDMYYEIYDGLRYMVVYDDTDIMDMGPTSSIVDIDYVPESGWSASKDVVLRTGNTYVVWTNDNHFAKFRVTGFTRDAVLFDWAYQTVHGSPLLKRQPTDGPRELVPHRR